MNAQTYDANDPRLTGYVLGELEPADREFIERQLSECPVSRAAVAEIRETIGMLEVGFAEEDSIGLSDTQRVAIERHAKLSEIADVADASETLLARRRGLGMVLTTACCLLVIAGIPLYFAGSTDSGASGSDSTRLVAQSANEPTNESAQSDVSDLHWGSKSIGHAFVAENLVAENPVAEVEPSSGSMGQNEFGRPAKGVAFEARTTGSQASYSGGAEEIEKVASASIETVRTTETGVAPPDGYVVLSAGKPDVALVATQEKTSTSHYDTGLSRRPELQPVTSPFRVTAAQAGDGSVPAPVVRYGQPTAGAPIAKDGLGTEAKLEYRLAGVGGAVGQSPVDSLLLEPQQHGNASPASGLGVAGRAWGGSQPAESVVGGARVASESDAAKKRSGLATLTEPAQGSVIVGKSEGLSQRRLGAVIVDVQTKTQGVTELADRTISADVAGNFSIVRTVPTAPDMPVRSYYFRSTPSPAANREAYAPIVENDFLTPQKQPLSTFSIDVDTAAYANVRRFLQHKQWPDPNAVRIEELVNYFHYDDAGPTDDKPFSASIEAANCPWMSSHRLVRIGLKGREVDREKRPPTNLVFLIDVSGSMRDNNKLPLVKSGLQMLVERMTEDDRVAIVTYAGKSSLALNSTLGTDKDKILTAIHNLNAGGSTNGEAGIQLAYNTAVTNFIENGSNRIVLCTDGDFNVGISDDNELVRLIEAKAKSRVFLSIFGFGMGNIKDSKLEQLADKGNGMYGYVDGIREARKVFVDDLMGTLYTIAKDVKVQVEFNPALVGAYRLIGYENRQLATEDFNDDRKDAGEIGAGHSLTVLYEVVPVDAMPMPPEVDPLKYQQAATTAPATVEVPDKPQVGPVSNELLTCKLRYKQPDADTSERIEFPFVDETHVRKAASQDLEWAAAVAGFGMLLRDSRYRGTADFDQILELARGNVGEDAKGYRAEFVSLVELAKGLSSASTQLATTDPVPTTKPVDPPSPPLPTPPVGVVRSIVGNWLSNWGPVTFTFGVDGDGKLVDIQGAWIQGHQMTGRITSGQFNTVTGQLKFTFHELWNGKTGTADLQLSADGNTLTGTWKYSDGGPSGKWRMTRERPIGPDGTRRK